MGKLPFSNNCGKKNILSKESVGIFQSWKVWEDMNAYPGEYKMLPLTARSGTQAS